MAQNQIRQPSAHENPAQPTLFEAVGDNHMNPRPDAPEAAALARLAEVDDAQAQPLTWRVTLADPDPECALDSLAGLISSTLNADGESGAVKADLYQLATGLYELGALRPAVKVLQHAVRDKGRDVGCCELMAKCLAGLERPDLALSWIELALNIPDLSAESRFELLRLASHCVIFPELAAA